MDEAGPGRGRGADRPVRVVLHGRPRLRLPRRAGRAVRRQDRRSGRREGRRRDDRPRRGAVRGARVPVGGGVRGRRPDPRHRRGPHRPRALGAGDLRRHPGGGPGAGSGLQADRRRRPRAQHRRHGRLLAGTDGGRRRGGHGDGRGGCPHPCRATGAGHRLSRCPLRRTDAHPGRSQGPRVQRPLRRPRDPGRAAPAHQRPGRAPRRRRRRRPGGEPHLRRWRRGDRRVRVGGLSPIAPNRRSDRRNGRGAGARRGERLLRRRGRRRRRRARHRRRTGARRHGSGPRPGLGAGRADDAVGHITWPGMHHRNDIASGAVDDLEATTRP